MGKNNRLTDGAFSFLIGNEEHEKFLHADDELGIDITPEIAQCKELYTRILNRNMGDIELLAKLEDTITQLRCKEVAKKDFRLSQTRGYIYARTPFFRKGSKIKDIRVIVGKAEDWKKYITNYGSAGENIDSLLWHKPFVIQAKERLQNAMTEQIKDNMTYINELEEKIFSA